MSELIPPHGGSLKNLYLNGESRQRMREQIERGVLDAQAGRFVDGDEAFSRIDARIKKTGRKRA